MSKVNHALRKLVSGKLLSMVLALLIAIVPLGTGLASTASAEGSVPTEVTLKNAVVSPDNQEVTLTFNVPVKAAGDNWESLIGIKRTNKGYYDSLENEESSAELLSDGKVLIHLGSQLSGATNQIRVQAGALISRDDSSVQLISDQVSSPIAANDITVPYSDSTVISSDLKKVTFTFNMSVQTATYVDGNGDTKEVNLHNAIQIRDSEEDSDFSSLSGDDQVSISGNQLVVEFKEPLVQAHKTIQIIENSIQSATGNKNNSFNTDVNTLPVSYTGYEISNEPRDLNLYFSQAVRNAGSEDALKGAITISKDGGAYYALSSKDEVTASGEDGLYLHFFNPLEAGSYRVKIAAGALVNEIGLLAGELITSDSGDGAITVNSALVYQKAELSADRKQVTLTFNKKLLINNQCEWSYEGGYQHVVCDEPIPYLFKKVKVQRDSDSVFRNLVQGDSIELNDNKLIIHLASALRGTNNKIAVNGYVLMDEARHVLPSGVITSALNASDTAPPAYQTAFISNLNQDLTLVFDKDINKASMEDLHKAITLVVGGVDKSLDPAATITIIGNLLHIRFPSALVDPYIQVKVAGGTLADTNGHILTDSVTTDLVTPGDFDLPEIREAYFFTPHSVRVDFNNDIMSRSGIDTTSSLKEAVTYSTDNGVTYNPLQARDEVTINRNSLIVYFDQIISGKLSIKIAGNVIQDLAGNILTKPVETGPIYVGNSAPLLTGSFFSNAASVLTYEDNSGWRSKIYKVVLNEYGNNLGWVERTLSSDEYSISAGKVTVRQGVLEENVRYELYIYADGYNRVITYGTAIPSQSSYYLSPVKVDTSSGITAKVRVLTNRSNGHLNVIFQLMNGQTPVSIVAGESDSFGAGTFTANFNVADAATNPNYTVRAFLASEYSNSPLSVGVNLATSVTDAEYDYYFYQYND